MPASSIRSLVSTGGDVSLAKRRKVKLGHVKVSTLPEKATAPPQKRRMAWSGGKIETNKHEALFLFFKRKHNKGEKLNETQTNALRNAVEEVEGGMGPQANQNSRSSPRRARPIDQTAGLLRRYENAMKQGTSNVTAYEINEEDKPQDLRLMLSRKNSGSGRNTQGINRKTQKRKRDNDPHFKVTLTGGKKSSFQNGNGNRGMDADKLLSLYKAKDQPSSQRTNTKNTNHAHNKGRGNKHSGGFKGKASTKKGKSLVDRLNSAL